MFLLSGLFASGSLRRKGSWTYACDRLWRIGLPFLLAAVFLSPLSYYPAYAIRTVDPSIAGYWSALISLAFLPNGPEWFLWQLLAVNLIGAGLYAIWPALIERCSRLAGWAAERPVEFILLLVAVSAIAYVPLALAFSPWRWSSIGPFALQLCRPGHYVVYFFAGFVLGSYGLGRGLLACDGPLARNWQIWAAAAVVTVCIWGGLTSLTLPDWSEARFAGKLAASFAYPVACVAGGFMLLALCLRFAADKRLWFLDSLSANAYSIYLVHYVFVVWLQYALLDSDLFAVGKSTIVFAGALAMSWAISVAFGRLIMSLRVVAVKRATISPLPR